MPGGSSGGNDAAKSAAGLEAIVVTAPLTGAGTAASPAAMPAATNASAGHMTAAQVTALEGLQLYADHAKLGAAAQRFGIIAGLNGNTIKALEFHAHIRIATATGQVRLRFNESITALDYIQDTFNKTDADAATEDAATAFTGFTNGPGIGSVLNIKGWFLELRTGVVRLGHFEASFDPTTAVALKIRRVSGAIRWNDTTTNLTAIEIDSDVAGCFDAGSWLKIKQVEVPT